MKGANTASHTENQQELPARNAEKEQLLSASPNAVLSSMGVTNTLNVTLFSGTNQQAKNVRNAAACLSEKFLKTEKK